MTPPVPSSSTTCDSSPHTPPSVPTAAFLFWPQRTDRLPFFEASTTSCAHPQSSHLPPSLSFIASWSVSPSLHSACKQAQSSSTLKSTPSGSESPYPPPHLAPSQTGGLWHRLSPDCPHTWVRLTTEDLLCAHCWENKVGHDGQGHLPREARSPVETGHRQLWEFRTSHPEVPLRMIRAEANRGPEAPENLLLLSL